MTSVEAPARCCVPLAAPTMSQEEAAIGAAVFKALADPARVRIVNLLANAGEPMCACDLEGRVGLSQPTISHHMKKLVGAGLVQRERRGTWAYYSLDPTACRHLAASAPSRQAPAHPAPADRLRPEGRGEPSRRWGGTTLKVLIVATDRFTSSHEVGIDTSPACWRRRTA